jgi:hypothetical protein
MSQEARNALVTEVEKPLLVGKVETLGLTLRELRSNLTRISHSANRLALAPPRPVAEDGKGSADKPNSLEMRLDDVQMSANDLCREAGYLADRLEKLA